MLLATRVVWAWPVVQEKGWVAATPEWALHLILLPFDDEAEAIVARFGGPAAAANANPKSRWDRLLLAHGLRNIIMEEAPQTGFEDGATILTVMQSEASLAMLGVGQLGADAKHALGAVIAQLDHPSEDVRAVACLYLRSKDDLRVTRALYSAALREEVSKVRWLMVQALMRQSIPQQRHALPLAVDLIDRFEAQGDLRAAREGLQNMRLIRYGGKGPEDPPEELQQIRNGQQPMTREARWLLEQIKVRW